MNSTIDISRPTSTEVLVVGAGIMGSGIAQVAAQSGHRVRLYDTRPGAAAHAIERIADMLDKLVQKGRLDADEARAASGRLLPIESLAAAAGVGLVVEAIVEDLEAKRALFRELEPIVGEECILATNTSSISVTAISNGLTAPGRLVGMHFFNPVPLMKLVEVVTGLHTEPGVADAISALAKHWGKVPVLARSTPGFIVNRIARPFYGEALGLLLERAVEPHVLDACMRAAGFRMGPCELIDLIGHDTNFAVTQSVYASNFYDKRYVPSLVQREMVEGGLLGRKSGRGFYRYPEGAPALAEVDHGAPPGVRTITVRGSGPVAEWLLQRANEAARARGCDIVRQPENAWTGLTLDDACIAITDGRCASAVAEAIGHPDVAVLDRPLALPLPERAPIAYSLAESSSDAWRRTAPAWIAALGLAPQLVADTPGLIVARTVAMLINEGADAVQQGVCSTEGADAAMKLGVNYPGGPFEWLGQWGAADVVQILQALDGFYAGERYRVSPWLRRALGRR